MESRNRLLAIAMSFPLFSLAERIELITHIPSRSNLCDQQPANRRGPCRARDMTDECDC